MREVSRQHLCSRSVSNSNQWVSHVLIVIQDMGLATDLAAQYDSPLPLAAAATELYKQAIAKDESYAKKDFSVLYEYLKKHASQSS